MTKSVGLLAALLALIWWAAPGVALAQETAGTTCGHSASRLWSWPLGAAQVSRGFDAPLTRYGPGHRGVDVLAMPGSEVCAAGAGVVSFAGRVAGDGVVVIRHSRGLRSTYLPVDPLVRVGQRIGVGQQIGTVAIGHHNCGSRACLHWGLISGDHYLDPRSLLSHAQVRVRLLPLFGSLVPRDPRAPGAPAPATALADTHSGRKSDPLPRATPDRPAPHDDLDRRENSARPQINKVASKRSTDDGDLGMPKYQLIGLLIAMGLIPVTWLARSWRHLLHRIGGR